MSSMQFTLEVLDLVILAGAGDGEMGGRERVCQQLLALAACEEL